MSPHMMRPSPGPSNGSFAALHHSPTAQRRPSPGPSNGSFTGFHNSSNAQNSFGMYRNISIGLNDSVCLDMAVPIQPSVCLEHIWTESIQQVR